MKIHLTTAAVLAAAAVPMIAQEPRTGVSNPEPITITAQPDEVIQPRKPLTKPSAAIPLDAQTSQTAPTGKSSAEVYGSYVPYRGISAAPNSTDATSFDPDSQIVTSVEERHGEVREGTLLHARIKQALSTAATTPGTAFAAEVTEPVEKEGRVVIPVGSLIEGRVTEVHGGRRISGAAAMHLEPRTVTLPDGTHYLVHAQLIDTDQTSHTTVDREGTLVRRDHPKETLAAIGLASGGAAAAGGVIGGGVGAVVGAGIGAGAGTIWWLKQDRQTAIPQDSLLVFSLTSPLPIMPSGSEPISRVEAPLPGVPQGQPAH